MTSEEALTIVINAALGDTPSKLIFNKNYAEIVNILVDDLKVSEALCILKQNLKYDIDGNIVLKMGYKNKDYKVVKELMDNDQQKEATSSTDRNQEIYITEERREELFNQLLDNELSKSKDEYHYEKEYLLSAEYLERICLGKTGLSDRHYTKLIKMLSKEYEEWKETKNGI